MIHLESDVSPRTARVLAGACLVLAVAAGVTKATADPTPTLIATGPPTYHRTSTPPAMVSRAQARQQIKAAGSTWAQFIAQTTDRPSYSADFIAAWLPQAPTQTP